MTRMPTFTTRKGLPRPEDSFEYIGGWCGRT
jgi:hypothetical protein